MTERSFLPGAALLVAAAVWAGSVLALAQGDSAGQPYRSVVKIRAQVQDQEELGTGFLWLDNQHVVTALHVVAGARSVQVYSEAARRQIPASVRGAKLEADLALLELNEPLSNLKPLQPARPRMDLEHYIWGYPLGVNKMQGDPIRFSRAMEQSSTMASLFDTPAKFRASVGNQGYPSYDAAILRVGSIITNGHSGAPILDEAGAVVGIGDGGLQRGSGRVNWAIPASIYLAKRLDSFPDRLPTRQSTQSSLMSVHVDQPVQVGLGAHDAALKLSWSAHLRDILGTLDKDEQQDYLDLAQSVDRQAFLNSVIDIYEDPHTRATIAVPRGMRFTYDPRSHVLSATNAKQNLGLYVQIVDNSTWEQGRQAWAAFDRWMLSGGQGLWQRDPKWPKDDVVQHKDYYSEKRYRIGVRDRQTVAWLEEELTIDEGDFLGTAVMARAPYDAADYLLHRLLVACSMLSDFAVN
jgi:S1-C subfamily serine protease